MRLRRFKIITITAIVGLAALAPYVVKLLASHYLDSARANLEKQGIKLSVDGLTGHLLGVTASSVDVWLPVRVGTNRFGFPVGLNLTNVSVSLELALAPRVRVRGEAYGGRLDFTLLHLRDLAGPIVRGQIEEIDLGAQPQLHALGLSRAITSLRLEDTRVPFDEHTGTQGELRLMEGNFSLSPKLIDLLGEDVQQVASLINVHEISNAALQVEGSIKEGTFSLRPLSLSSSLGEVSGNARGAIGRGHQAPSLSATFKVSLSDETRHLQGWLPLISNNMVSGEADHFTTNISSTPCEGAIAPIFRMGRMCLRSTLSS